MIIEINVMDFEKMQFMMHFKKYLSQSLFKKLIILQLRMIYFTNLAYHCCTEERKLPFAYKIGTW